MDNNTNLNKLFIFSSFMLLSFAQGTLSQLHSSAPLPSPRTHPFENELPISHISAPIPSAEIPSKTTFSMRRLLTRMLKEFRSSNHQARLLKSNFVPASSKSKTNNPNLKKICDQTDYASLCLSSITPYFNGKTDTVSVLQMAINATVQQTKLAISAAEKLATASNTPDETASTLSDCKQNYEDALDDLQSAQDAIPENDIGTINTMLSAAITEYGTCNDEFSGPNPMANYGDKLTKMNSNCLVIASLLK
ncbi:hypothetical protein P3X46_027917 [Hevea brasiliensis]|uniref:Pectinesterase inhibitor domain-containing protein n=1 Tax=Hevea brasiliensis TaxID=3981 RepID=A0ABQ9L4H8_HEVBR|nr:pectinesterase inhibitor-like [Hevea brasiliensis]KAJ9154597.1 hypothetical protein P3X46_027917 [Hevea brasiliensis]